MGYLARFFGIETKGNRGGKGGDLVSRPDTPDGALTPDNPGAIVPFRSMPVPTEPRYFDGMTAEALDTQAQKRKQMVASTKKGYSALETVSNCDAEVVESHSNFQKTDAINALKQVQSQAGVKSLLSDLRPGFEQVDAQLEFSSEQADKKIDWIEKDLDEALAILEA